MEVVIEMKQRKSDYVSRLILDIMNVLLLAWQEEIHSKIMKLKDELHNVDHTASMRICIYDGQGSQKPAQLAKYSVSTTLQERRSSHG